MKRLHRFKQNDRQMLRQSSSRLHQNLLRAVRRIPRQQHHLPHHLQSHPQEARKVSPLILAAAIHIWEDSGLQGIVPALSAVVSLTESPPAELKLQQEERLLWAVFLWEQN